MVRLQLLILAELENVTNLQPASEDYEFFFKVKCTDCNEVYPKIVSLNRNEEFEVTGSKGATAHFVSTCGFCKRRNWAKFDTSKKIQPYTCDRAQLQPLVEIECRGLEFIGFEFRGLWKCTGTKGTEFDDINLEDGDWVDYDEKAALPVGITGLDSHWSGRLYKSCLCNEK